MHDLAREYSTEPAARGGATTLNARHAQELSRIIQARRLRQKFFPAHLFSDPAWDILLTLALAQLKQHRVTVTNLCAGSAAPHTTALRYIQAMVDEGLIERLGDPLDGRRKFVSLSESGSKQMTCFLNMHPASYLKAA